MAELYTSEKKKIANSVEDPASHSHNPLGSFCYRPHNINFESQETEEKVILLLRQHPITNIPWILMAILLVLAPNVLNYFPLLSFLPTNFQFVAILFWYLIVLAFIVESSLSWFFNVYIVTTQRVIDVDFVDLIYRDISSAELEHVQETSSSIGGTPGTIFNYGNVIIQTASAHPSFDFISVPQPDRVVKIIEELRDEGEIGLEKII